MNGNDSRGCETFIEQSLSEDWRNHHEEGELSEIFFLVAEDETCSDSATRAREAWQNSTCLSDTDDKCIAVGDVVLGARLGEIGE